MNVRHPEGVIHSFSIKNIFHDKMDVGLFYFHKRTRLEFHITRDSF